MTDRPAALISSSTSLEAMGSYTRKVLIPMSFIKARSWVNVSKLRSDSPTGTGW